MLKILFILYSSMSYALEVNQNIIEVLSNPNNLIQTYVNCSDQVNPHLEENLLLNCPNQWINNQFSISFIGAGGIKHCGLYDQEQNIYREVKESSEFGMSDEEKLSNLERDFNQTSDFKLSNLSLLNKGSCLSGEKYFGDRDSPNKTQNKAEFNLDQKIAATGIYYTIQNKIKNGLLNLTSQAVSLEAMLTNPHDKKLKGINKLVQDKQCGTSVFPETIQLCQDLINCSATDGFEQLKNETKVAVSVIDELEKAKEIHPQHIEEIDKQIAVWKNLYPWIEGRKFKENIKKQPPDFQNGLWEQLNENRLAIIEKMKQLQHASYCMSGNTEYSELWGTSNISNLWSKEGDPKCRKAIRETAEIPLQISEDLKNDPSKKHIISLSSKVDQCMLPFIQKEEESEETVKEIAWAVKLSAATAGLSLGVRALGAGRMISILAGSIPASIDSLVAFQDFKHVKESCSEQINSWSNQESINKCPQSLDGSNAAAAAAIESSTRNCVLSSMLWSLNLLPFVTAGSVSILKSSSVENSINSVPGLNNKINNMEGVQAQKMVDEGVSEMPTTGVEIEGLAARGARKKFSNLVLDHVKTKFDQSATVEHKVFFDKTHMIKEEYHITYKKEGKDYKWVVTNDRSIKTWQEKVEINSPILQSQDDVDDFIEVIGKLEEAGIKTNKTSGLHIHVGWPGANAGDAALIGKSYSHIYDEMAQIFKTHKERMGSLKSSPESLNKVLDLFTGSSKNIEELLNLKHNNFFKRRMFNLAPLRKLGTVEYRVFNSTLNKEQIKLMIDFSQKFTKGFRDRDPGLMEYIAKTDPNNYSVEEIGKILKMKISDPQSKEVFESIAKEAQALQAERIIPIIGDSFQTAEVAAAATYSTIIYTILNATFGNDNQELMEE